MATSSARFSVSCWLISLIHARISGPAPEAAEVSQYSAKWASMFS